MEKKYSVDITIPAIMSFGVYAESEADAEKKALAACFNIVDNFGLANTVDGAIAWFASSLNMDESTMIVGDIIEEE